MNKEQLKAALKELGINPKGNPSLETLQKLYDENTIPHIITEQDLKKNPELKDKVKVGDEIRLPKTTELTPPENSEPPITGEMVVEVMMKENVKHDGVYYKKGQKAFVDKETKELFEKKNFC